MKFIAGFVIGATAALLFETLLAFIVLAIAAAVAWRAIEALWPAPIYRTHIWVPV